MTKEEAGAKAGLIITTFLMAEKDSYKHQISLTVCTFEENQLLTIVLHQEGSPATFLFNGKFARLVASLWEDPTLPWNQFNWTNRAEEYAKVFSDVADMFDEVAAKGDCRTPEMKLN